MIEQLKPILDAISDYSVTIIIIGLFVVLIWQMFSQKKEREKADQEQQKMQNDYITKMNQEQQEYLQSLLDKAILALKSSLLEKEENHIKEEPENYQYNSHIIDAMTESLNAAKASYGFFFSYHNGGKDYEGRSYQRMSCTNEVTNGRVQPLQTKYNNMFRTSVYYVYKKLNDIGYYDILNIEDIKNEDPGTYHMMSQDGIHANIGCSIVNSNGDPIGFIALAFTEPQNNKATLVNILKRCKYKIEGIYSTF